MGTFSWPWTVDGARVAFTGDSWWFRTVEGQLAHSLIYRNHLEADSYLKAIRVLARHAPELLCTGHVPPIEVDPSVFAATEHKMDELRNWFVSLLPDGRVDAGLDPSWVRLEPYQPVVGPGDILDLRVHIRSVESTPCWVDVRLVLPPGWETVPDVLRLDIGVMETKVAPIRIAIPSDWRPVTSRFAVAADVWVDGRHVGQLTEAICEVRGSAPNLQAWT